MFALVVSAWLYRIALVFSLVEDTIITKFLWPIVKGWNICSAQLLSLWIFCFVRATIPTCINPLWFCLGAIYESGHILSKPLPPQRCDSRLYKMRSISYPSHSKNNCRWSGSLYTGQVNQLETDYSLLWHDHQIKTRKGDFSI